MTMNKKTSDPMNAEIKELTKKAEVHAAVLAKISTEIKKVIVGQEDVVKKILVALVANGHVLVEGVPGLAKTLLIKTLAACIDTQFVRIQFTPDLLPADITGTKIYSHKDEKFSLLKGPIFTNFVLADEINRAPPKVQSALLEAMQERQVSIQGKTIALEEPFLVLATQNPIESEGTYKLPEAQVDRFLFKLVIDYPKKDEERAIIERFTKGQAAVSSKVTTAAKIVEMQQFNQTIYADDKIEEYVAEIVDATRHPATYKIDINGHIEFGASPRASIALILAGKAHAMISGRGFVTPDDIRAVAHEVLRHRIILTYEAEAENITTDMVIKKILDTIRVP